MDKNAIFNQALGLISHGEVDNINNDTTKAKAGRLYFEACAREALAYDDWWWARKYHKPNLYAKSYAGFKYAYIYPNDCLAPRRYLDTEGNDVDVSGCRNVLADNNALKLILSNRKIEQIVYTASVMNTEIWDTRFIAAYIYLLAGRIIAKVSGENKEHNEKMQIYADLIETAARYNRREDEKTFDREVCEGYQPIWSGRS